MGGWQRDRRRALNLVYAFQTEKQKSQIMSSDENITERSVTLSVAYNKTTRGCQKETIRSAALTGDWGLHAIIINQEL